MKNAKRLFREGREENWATYTLMEAPFWRDGMTPEEYELERTYLGLHWRELAACAYRPLWKQLPPEAYATTLRRFLRDEKDVPSEM